MVIDQRIFKYADGDAGLAAWLTEVDDIFRTMHKRSLFDVFSANPRAMDPGPQRAYDAGYSPGDFFDNTSAWIGRHASWLGTQQSSVCL